MSQAREPDTCGCCEKTEIEYPKHENPPSQSVIAYRIGTHAFFMRRMMARLSSLSITDNKDLRPPASLTSRESDDPSIALLDAWATAADVLTFYQERIACEGYLRTATERRSVLELARAIGYELNPGVAASTLLAFTVEDSPGSPGVTKVPKGTKVLNIPAQGKLPQTFETVEDIEARAEWNALKPRLTQPQNLAIQTNDSKIVYANDIKTEVMQLYIAGTDMKLKEGDLLLIVRKSGTSLQTLLKRIKHISIEYESNNKIKAESNRAIIDRSKLGTTRVDFEDDAPSVHKFIQPEPEPKSGKINIEPLEFNETNVKKYIFERAWNERDIGSFLALNRWDEKEMLKHINTLKIRNPSGIDEGVFAFRQRVGFFGHNAPLFGSLPKGDYTHGDPYDNYDWDKANNETGRNIWEYWKDGKYSDDDKYPNADVFLERSLPEILHNSWVVFEGNGIEPVSYRVNTVSEASMTGYGLSAKTTGLKLKLPDGITDPDKTIKFKVRKTTAHVQSERLELADMPIDDPVEEKNEKGENTGAASLMLDRMVLGLHVGQALVLSGEQADAAGIIRNEIVVIEDISHEGGYTKICFRDRLKYRYVRKTVTLNANVARATHGETGHEVMGSGDGSKINQRFVLRKSPLTYVSAPTSGGIKNTLEVRVNNALWEEKKSLYGLDGRSQNYIVRIDDDAKATVIFGDGKSGARLPSGTENIVATYRSGTGNEGEVVSGSLALLQTMPLGIKAVTNPLPASGAKDPEKLEMARTNAPTTVLTVDRIVSLRDFEDFARTFGGIGKASAVALRDREKHFVHITVAGENGKTVDSNLKTNLVNGIRAACDPMQQVGVGDFILSTFSLQAKILVDTHYLFEDVKKEVERALLDSFTFEKREFGQSVSSAEVLKVIHDVKTVDAVDLKPLKKDAETAHPTDQPPAILTANKAHLKNGEVQLAELLLLNPVGVTIEKMEERR